MFKIGEFSRLGQVSVRMLRHYDALGLLAPSHTDPFTAYRYYTIDQLPRLHRIVALNSLGITLEQVGALLQVDGELSNERLRGMLALRQAELEQELADRAFQLRSVAARLQQLDDTPPPYEVILRPVEPLAIASVRACVPRVAEMSAFCAALYGRLYGALERRGLTHIGPELTLYHAEEYVETDLDTEVAVVVDPQLLAEGPGEDGLSFRALPEAPQAASLVFEGAYEDVGSAALALLGWVGARGLRPAAPLRELHRSGPAHPRGGPAVVPAVIELQLPVRLM
jgi:DNA-binding transcriptional MerR regulator/effector-binding domain-containing protein